jgi:hypothetical protein
MCHGVNVTDEVHVLAGSIGKIRIGFEFGKCDSSRRAYVLLADVRIYEGDSVPSSQKPIDQKPAVAALAKVSRAQDYNPPPVPAWDALG